MAPGTACLTHNHWRSQDLEGSSLAAEFLPPHTFTQENFPHYPDTEEGLSQHHLDYFRPPHSRAVLA